MKAALRGVSSRYFAALEYSDYRWLWLAAMGGASAYWALIVARGILVLEMSDSSAMVGIVTFAAMGPRFLIPPLAGFLADRFNRRSVLAAAYWANTFNNGILAVLALSGSLELWHVLVLSVLNGTARTFQMTATASLVPNLVPREKLLNAVSLNSATQQGSRLIGPGLIAPLLAIYGPDAAFVGCTVFYVVGLVMVSRIQTRSTGGLGRGSNVLSSMAVAAGVVYRHTQLRALFAIVAFHCAMTMSFEAIFPAMSLNVLNADREGVSYLMMAVGAGGLVSAIIVAGVRGEGMRGRVLLVAGVVSGLSMLGLASAGSLQIALLAAAGMGASQAAFMALLSAMVQTLAPEEMRGRISGLNQVNLGGTMAIFNLVNGFAVEFIGVQTVLLVLGLGFAGIIVVSMSVSSLRKIYTQGIPLSARAPVAA